MRRARRARPALDRLAGAWSLKTRAYLSFLHFLIFFFDFQMTTSQKPKAPSPNLVYLRKPHKKHPPHAAATPATQREERRSASDRQQTTRAVWSEQVRTAPDQGPPSTSLCARNPRHLLNSGPARATACFFPRPIRWLAPRGSHDDAANHASAPQSTETIHPAAAA